MKFTSSKRNGCSVAAAILLAQPATSMLIPMPTVNGMDNAQSVLNSLASSPLAQSAIGAVGSAGAALSDSSRRVKDWNWSWSWGNKDPGSGSDGPLIDPEVENLDKSSYRILEAEGGVIYIGSESMKLKLKRNGINFMDITDHIDFYQELEDRNFAMALAAAEDEQDSNVPVPISPFPITLNYTKEVKGLFPEISKENLQLTLATFTSYHTRYYKSEYGLNASLWLAEKASDIARNGTKDGEDSKIKVHTFHHPWGQKSVIATIPGKSSKAVREAKHVEYMTKHKMKSKNYDPSTEAELLAHYAYGDVVVVSAHLDSTNLLFPNLLSAPGADDNGSGTVTILEVFRTLVASGYEPENTIQFHWYSAEEGGLLGSQAVMTEYKRRGIAVRALLQQDMTGYLGKGIEKLEDSSFGVITDFTDPELTLFVEKVIGEYADIPFIPDACGYACSDHASANKVGYPSAFVIESPMKISNPYIHSVMDTIDRLSFEKMEQHARITLGYVYELGLHDFSDK